MVSESTASRVLKKLWTVDIVPGLTGSIPLTKELSPEPANDSCEDKILSPAGVEVPAALDKRNFERFDVSPSRIPVTIRLRDGLQWNRGVLQDASVTGMFVRTRKPLPFRTLLRVKISVLDGLEMEFAGRVVRSTDRGFAIHLETSDEDWRFRATFIDLARSKAAVRPTLALFEATESELERFHNRAIDFRDLRALWQTAAKRLESDELQQEFITECMQRKRLEFAFERYRELKKLQPQLEIADRYLHQIGTILTFYSSMRHDEPAPKRWYKPVFAMMFFALVAAVSALVAGQAFAG